MKIIQTCLASLALACGLVACSNSETNSAAENLPAKIETSADVTEITWEDLMPEGEDELLETLYVEFYQEFERNLVKNSTSLSQATPQETDVSTLITEGSAADTMEQIGTFNVVKDFDGKRIRVPGYVVPFDFNADAEHKEFLLSLIHI